MSNDLQQHAGSHAAELNQEVAGGLNSSADTKSWQAGNELGPAMKDEAEKEDSVDESHPNESSTPLFLRDSPEGAKGNAQDEKDEKEE